MNMKKVIFKSDRAAAMQCGALEADAVSKKSMRLKNLKNRDKILKNLIIATLIMFAAFTSCNNAIEENNRIAVTSVSLPSEITLLVGNSEILLPTIIPAEATDNSVTWKSDATGIAEVDANGKVTAKAKGITKITVTTNDGGKTAQCTVTVTEAPSNDPNFYNPQKGDVYVAGYNSNATNWVNAARLWKNGVARRLPGDRAAVANSVYISNGNVYVAGYDREPSSAVKFAILWKNGVKQQLTNGTQDAEAFSVFISGNDVYVAGYEGNKAILWKNGIAHSLSTAYAKANSVFISGNDVYVAGYERVINNQIPGNQIGKLWKNGEEQILSGAPGLVTSVFVSGNDVYAVGSGILWENGVAQSFTGNSSSSFSSVFISGSDIYIAGTQISGTNSSTAALWKNGVAQSLAGGGEADLLNMATSVFISGSDVYVAGTQASRNSSTPTLWINGKKQILADGTAANSVFVVK